MSQRIISLDSQRRIISEVRDTISRGSAAISGLKVAMDSVGVDSWSRYTPPTTFSSPRAWGLRNVPDHTLKFASEREPIVRWLVYWVSVDIFDNWFKVIDPSEPNSDKLDDAVQEALKAVKAKQELIRLITFERRYGTAAMLCAYTGQEGEGWAQPVYYEDGTFLNRNNRQLLQVTPYPWTKVNITDKVTRDDSLRYGLPEFYDITRGDVGETKVHWSRVIHAATRLDEDAYEGVSVVLAVYDDATGFRNLRWAMYETMFRYGSGFPVFTFPWATAEEIRNWIASGEIANWNARGFLVAGEEGETVEFKGVQDVTLNPSPYFKHAMEAISTATRIPVDVLIGVSAGRITGSEVNERAYFKFISSEQSMVEPIVRELIDRLIDTGQIKYGDGRKGTPSKNYDIEWFSGFSLNEMDEARVKLWGSTADKNYTEYKTIDEVREENKLPPLPDDKGKVILGLQRVKAQQQRLEFNPPQEKQGTPQPKEEEVQENRPEEREPV